MSVAAAETTPLQQRLLRTPTPAREAVNKTVATIDAGATSAAPQAAQLQLREFQVAIKTPTTSATTTSGPSSEIAMNSPTQIPAAAVSS
mmetsp:Transcript_80132/g.223128  ORF Transcript_80132/g.223128 Transcript_80132/m.223128 type:complete len:89 (-) Transcript_80132:615-881(-)